MSVKYWIDRGIMDAGFVNPKLRLYMLSHVFIHYDDNGIVQFFMLYPFSRFDYNSKNYREFSLHHYYFLCFMVH